MIGVTFALPAESARFVRRLTNRTRAKLDDTEIVYGTLGRVDVAVFHTGVGEKVCRRRMAAFLQDRQLQVLISAGFAGALRRDLRVGDVLIAENFSTFDLQRARPAFENNVHVGKLVTSSRVIDTAVERKRIAEQTGAIAVDMETEFVARACAERALPLLSLRAISDTPARPLPAPPDVLFDVKEQKTKLLRLGGYLATHPVGVVRLAKFARQVKTAQRVLTSALESLVKTAMANS